METTIFQELLNANAEEAVTSCTGQGGIRSVRVKSQSCGEVREAMGLMNELIKQLGQTG